MSWSQIAATTLADQVYHAVRARILEGHLAPGEFIREKDLEQALGVSRTPIREALSRLASEGFLERLPHRGFHVPDQPLSDLLELYPIVAALDHLAGRLALPRLSEADVETLKEINGRLRAAKDGEDVQALIDLNNQFHQLFSDRSGNARLAGLLGDLRLQLTRLERWYYSYGAHTDESIRQHDAIIRAIEDGDFEKALQVLEHNMSLTYESLIEEVQAADES